MYAHIKGNVEEIYADRVVIEAAGVGYELVCSKMTLKRLCEGKTAKLFVHFHLSQDSVALYGFFDAEERAMFRKLISVSRIGPKVALAVLSVLTPSDVALAVLTDEDRLVLDRFYIHPMRGNVDRLRGELGLEDERSVYKRKDKALRRFTVALYGICEQ